MTIENQTPPIPPIPHLKIVIQYHEGEWPIDPENPHERSLDELLDTFTSDEVRTIINETLRTFRGLCDLWNQREMAQRRQLEAGTSPAQEV